MNGTGLSPADAARVITALGVLRDNGLRDFAITGGVAVAAHLATSQSSRPLNDLDLVVEGASLIPSGLAAGLLVSHVHLGAKPGRMLLQLVEPTTRLRIDLFGTIRGQLRRSRSVGAAHGDHRIVSRADLAARMTGLLLDLGLDEAVPAKHARDQAALLAGDPVDGIEAAWADHRRTRHPECFEEACHRAQALKREKAYLLTTSEFKRRLPCARCREAAGFRLAEDQRIVEALGYR